MYNTCPEPQCQTILSMYNTCLESYCQTYNSFWFLLTEEYEPCWFFFAGFLFLSGKGGGGDSWPMANLATWCLPDGGMTSSFINHNNCSCIVSILCGVRYCLLKSIFCNFKNQINEVISMCLGIKMQNKSHVH